MYRVVLYRSRVKVRLKVRLKVRMRVRVTVRVKVRVRVRVRVRVMVWVRVRILDGKPFEGLSTWFSSLFSSSDHYFVIFNCYYHRH